MSCEDIRERLTGYLEGELDDADGSAVRGHLRTCAECRQVAADEAALRDGLRALAPVDPPPSLWAGVQARLAIAEVADAERPSWRRAVARWAPAARTRALPITGAFAAAAVMLIWWRTHRQPDEVVVAPHHEVIPIAVVAPPPAPSPDDVTADLDAEAARVTAQYEQTAQELVALSVEARVKWSDEQQASFDAGLASRREQANRAEVGRPRQRALRSLIRFVQNAVVRDEVALASTGGRP